jgi:hypothetical protein
VRVQQHLDLGQQRLVAARRRHVAPRRLDGRFRQEALFLVEADNPSLRVKRVERSGTGKILIECGEELIGFIEGNLQGLAGSDHHAVAQHAQVHRVGARPPAVAGIGAARGEAERPGCERVAWLLERFMQPLLQRQRIGAFAPAARQQQLEGGIARPGLGRQQPRDDQLAVHGAARRTVRTPGRPRWRARMR